MSETQKLRGRAITYEEARDAANRFINEHYSPSRKGQVQTSIPLRLTDHDVVLNDYLTETHTRLAQAEALLRREYDSYLSAHLPTDEDHRFWSCDSCGGSGWEPDSFETEHNVDCPAFSLRAFLKDGAS